MTLNVEVISGTLERDVIVVFTTESGTATEEGNIMKILTPFFQVDTFLVVWKPFL